MCIRDRINLVADAANRTGPGAHLSIASRTDDSTVEILVSISGALYNKPPATDSFSMLLARTLSELSGARLIADQDNSVAPGATGEWHVVARFARAVQNDFFRTAH